MIDIIASSSTKLSAYSVFGIFTLYPQTYIIEIWLNALTSRKCMFTLRITQFINSLLREET